MLPKSRKTWVYRPRVLTFPSTSLPFSDPCLSKESLCWENTA